MAAMRDDRDESRPGRVAALAVALLALPIAVLILSALPARAAAAIPASAYDWQQLASPTSPPASASGAMTYDAASKAIVYFGGWGPGEEPRAETWTWDAGGWSEQHPAHSPPATARDSLAYDGASHQVVLFGGSGSAAGETWTWDGTDWTERHPLRSPPSRENASMAYDAATGEVVLFGGRSPAETWTWDGEDWTEQQPVHEPPAHYDATMTYDASDGQVVLFGGLGEFSFVAETWTWDGEDWTLRHPAHSPSPRAFLAAEYEPESELVVLFGGATDENTVVAETWTWDGADWTEQQPAHHPPARAEHVLSYDAAAARLVLFGGEDYEPLFDTWTYRPAGPPTAIIDSPLPGSTFVQGSAVGTTFHCADSTDGPGIASCLDSGGAPASHGSLDTSSLGPHDYLVTATSADGRTASTSLKYLVVVAPPSGSSGSIAGPRGSGLLITHRPHRGNRNPGEARWSFRFHDEAPGATYSCSLDGRPFRRCSSPKVYRHLKPGRHFFKVRSTNAAGEPSAVRSSTFVVAGSGR